MTVLVLENTFNEIMFKMTERQLEGIREDEIKDIQETISKFSNDQVLIKNFTKKIATYVAWKNLNSGNTYRTSCSSIAALSDMPRLNSKESRDLFYDVLKTYLNYRNENSKPQLAIIYKNLVDIVKSFNIRGEARQRFIARISFELAKENFDIFNSQSEFKPEDNINEIISLFKRLGF